MPDDHMSEQRLRAIEVAQAEVLTLLRALSIKMDERIKEGDDWQDKVERILHGDGNGYKGHNVRLDRLEQSQERSKWFVRSLLVPVILLALKAGADILAGLGG